MIASAASAAMSESKLNIGGFLVQCDAARADNRVNQFTQCVWWSLIWHVSLSLFYSKPANRRRYNHSITAQ